MGLNSLFNLLGALLIMIVAAAFYIVYYMKNLRLEIENMAYQLSFETTHRSDLLPLYIETLNKYFPPGSFQDLIKLRTESMQIKDFGISKKDKEEALWQLFNTLLNTANKKEETKKDTFLAALNKDLAKANQNVAEKTNLYNKLVGKYNSLDKNPFIKLVSIMVRKRNFENF